MTLISMLKNECECMGNTYTLTSSLDDPNITVTGKSIKGEVKNIVGYATLENLIIADEKVHLNTILKSGLKPEMMGKDWEHLYAIKLNTEKGSENQTALILVTHALLLERFVKEWIVPLKMTATQLTNFAKEINQYAKDIRKREEERQLAEAVEAILKARPTLKYEEALGMLKEN